MSDGPNDDRMTGQIAEGSVDRRGILAWAATLAGAGLAWLAGTGRAEATHSAGTGGPANSDSQALHVDLVNAGTQRTFLVGTVAGNPPMVMFNGSGPFSIGQADAIQGITRSNVGAAAGIQGRSQATTGGVGVLGTTASTTGAGVVGYAGLSTFVPTNVGVYGRASSDGGMGVRGQIPVTTGASTIAVYGENFSTDSGGAPGAGGFGVYGYSDKGHGLVGATGTAGGGALIGSTNGVAGAYAGIFYGALVVLGSKSAAVPHPDGSHRLLYCLESPESWFEDFGSATLARGCANVTIDPEFAMVVDLSDYHVFLTPYGNTKGLHVAERTPTSFTVEEHEGGHGEISFGWRLVAKRKDIDARRLAKVTLPTEPPAPVRPEPERGAVPEENPAPRKKTVRERPHAHR